MLVEVNGQSIEGLEPEAAYVIIQALPIGQVVVKLARPKAGTSVPASAAASPTKSASEDGQAEEVDEAAEKAAKDAARAERLRQMKEKRLQKKASRENEVLEVLKIIDDLSED